MFLVYIVHKTTTLLASMNRHVTHVAFASHPHYSQAEVSPPAFNGFEISKYYKHRQYNKISMFSGTIHQREDSGKHYAFVQTQRIPLKFFKIHIRQRRIKATHDCLHLEDADVGAGPCMRSIDINLRCPRLVQSKLPTYQSTSNASFTKLEWNNWHELRIV